MRVANQESTRMDVQRLSANHSRMKSDLNSQENKPFEENNDPEKRYQIDEVVRILT
jgi:hypothetical protein